MFVSPCVQLQSQCSGVASKDIFNKYTDFYSNNFVIKNYFRKKCFMVNPNCYIQQIDHPQFPRFLKIPGQHREYRITVSVYCFVSSSKKKMYIFNCPFKYLSALGNSKVNVTMRQHRLPREGEKYKCESHVSKERREPHRC